MDGRGLEVILKEMIDPESYRAGKRIELPGHPHPSERVIRCGCGSSRCNDYANHGVNMIAVYYGGSLCKDILDRSRFEVERRRNMLEKLSCESRDQTFSLMRRHIRRSMDRWQSIVNSIETQIGQGNS